MAQTVLLNGSKFWGDLNRMHMCNVWASGRCRLGENCGCKHASWCCISARVHTCKSLVFCNCYVHLLQETQLTNFTPEWGSSCSWGAGQVVESAAKVSSIECQAHKLDKHRCLQPYSGVICMLCIYVHPPESKKVYKRKQLSFCLVCSLWWRMSSKCIN